MIFEKLIAFFPLIFFFLLLFASFFLNYISSLYSEADLFKIDLTKERKKPKFKRLIFVLKNGHLLFSIISFLQVILNMFISIMSIERIDERLFLRVNKFVFILMMGFFIALFTEIFSRYLGTRQFSKKLIQNNFFIDFSYSLIRIPFALLHKIVRPKKKLFVNSEVDVIRFINNLAAENILEKQEARLVQSAFNFDELRVNSVFTPWKKVIFLSEDMSYEEIQKIYLQYFFTRYPVLNKKNEVIGIFNLETFYWALIKDKNSIWQNQIDKKLIFVAPDEKLDKVFEKLQLNYCHLAIVKVGKRLLGVITLQNILNSLVGKMRDEKDRLLPRRLN